MRRLYAVCLLLMCSVYTLPQAAKSVGNTIRDKYRVIEVSNFETKQGVDLPPDYFTGLQDELVKQLSESHQFEAVLRPEQQPPTADAPVLRLAGVVTGFKEGSRAKRYFAGFGAGTSQIFAHVKYVDRATGETLIETEVIGTLSGGAFGGNSKNVLRDFAKALVTTTKLTVLKPLPAPKGEAAQPATSAEPAAETERETLDISSGDLEPKQEKLNELAAKGYRITNYASTSNKSATLTLEKVADSSENHRYLMLQTTQAGTLQKELNKAAADGYRLVPHTLGYLNGYFLIAEKSVHATSAQYEYRIHATIKVSSAEKNVKEDHAQGFLLIDTTQVQNNVHVIVLEREAGQKEPAA